MRRMDILCRRGGFLRDGLCVCETHHGHHCDGEIACFQFKVPCLVCVTAYKSSSNNLGAYWGVRMFCCQPDSARTIFLFREPGALLQPLRKLGACAPDSIGLGLKRHRRSRRSRRLGPFCQALRDTSRRDAWRCRTCD